MGRRVRQNILGEIVSHEWKFKLGNRLIRVTYKDKNQPWGRFGGGWQYHLGVEFSTLKDVMVYLGFFYLRIKKVETKGGA